MKRKFNKYFVEPTKQQELISEIFRFFPEARILTPTEVKKLKQGKWELPAREGARRATRRAGKHEQAEESYSLFDVDWSGGGT